MPVAKPLKDAFNKPSLLMVGQARGRGDAGAPGREVHLRQLGAVTERTVRDHAARAAHHHPRDQHIAHRSRAAVAVAVDPRLELLGPEIAEAARRIGAEMEAVKSPATDTPVQAIPGPWAFQGAYPFWSAESRRLVWADVLAPAVRCLDLSGGEPHDFVLARIEAPIRAMLPRGDSLLVLHENGVASVAPDGAVSAVEDWPAAARRAIALCEGSDRDLWVAVPAAGEGCNIGLLKPGGALVTQWSLAETVQALRWSANDGRLYATTPASGSILVLEPGSSAVRRLTTVPKGAGKPHGIALDATGGIWTAMCEGWSLMRLLADGTLDRVVGMPVPCPSDVCIGGTDSRSLFITSSRQQVSLEVLAKAGLSGRLFELAL